MNQLEQKLEQDFGIVFSQKDLLETAFTHTSYANEHRLLNISHNERLEFLGDAALQLVISVYLYNRYLTNRRKCLRCVVLSFVKRA